MGERTLLPRMVLASQAEGRAMQRPERGTFNVFDRVGEELAWLETITKGGLEGDGVRELAGAGSGGALCTW